MEKAANSITRLICRDNPNLTTQQVETIKFGLECILGEASKTIVYLIIFSILSLTDHFIVAMLFFCIPRTFAGGYHANTFLQCFIITFFTMSAAIFTGSQFGLPFPVRIAFLLTAIVLAWVFAPVDHPNKPIISIDRRNLFRRLSVIVFFILACITFLFNTDLASTAATTLLLEALSLPIGLQMKK